MVAGAFAGLFKVGAVAVVAGGLGTGVYFVANQDDADAPEEVLATVTPGDLAAPGQLTPPAATPAPVAIDTANWPAYASPLGLTLKYPPAWAVEELGNTAKILNEARQLGVSRMQAAGQNEGHANGEAWVEIYPNAHPAFNVEELYQICGLDDQSAVRQAGRTVEATHTVLAGLPAVVCTQDGPDPYDPERQMRTELNLIGMPSGGVVGVIALAIDPSSSTDALLDAVVASLSFAAGAPVDTSDWQAYTSPLGFSLKYPSNWRLETRERGVTVMNPILAQLLKDVRAAGQNEYLPVAGMASFGAGMGSPFFDVDHLIRGCRVPHVPAALEGPADRADVVIYQGRRAVRCQIIELEETAPDASGMISTLEHVGLTYWIEFPAGHTLGTSGGGVAASQEDLAIVAAIRDSFTLLDPP